MYIPLSRASTQQSQHKNNNKSQERRLVHRSQMSGSSRTANALMMWGANVVSAQRELRGLHGYEDQAVGRSKQSMEDECSRVAQKLVDETNELEYCEQILSDNEKEFKNREQELLDALHEITRQMKMSQQRPVADEVRLREEALWHLESTLRRLEKEEDIQGQAIVAIADCISSCQVSHERACSLLDETASLTCRSLLQNVRELREVCVAFQSQSEASGGFFDDTTEMEMSSIKSRLASDAPIRLILTEAYQKLLNRCNRLRSCAEERFESLMSNTVSLRSKCDRQSLAIDDSHQAIDELRVQSEEVLREIESCSHTEALLKGELKVRASRQSSLVETRDSLVKHKHVKAGANGRLEKEGLGIMEERNKLVLDTQTQLQLKEDLISKRQAFYEKWRDKQISLKRFGSSDPDQDVLREVSRKTHSIELEIEGLRERLRRLNEEENISALSVQTLHSRLLEVRAVLGDVKAQHKQISEEIPTLQETVDSRASQVEVARLEIERCHQASQNASEILASMGQELSAQEELGTQFSETISLLKKTLLERQERPPIRVSSNAHNSHTLNMKDSTHTPYVASKLENAVSTAPLSRLLLSDTKAPLRVPLEPRHRVPDTSDAVRDYLVKAFQL